MVRIPSQFLKQRSPQAGFTIVESLMAIVVVAILLAAVTPAITLSVAMRVQSKRVEQATQAARTYINGVRTYNVTTATGGIAPPAHAIALGTTGTAASNAALLNNVPPPIVGDLPSGLCAPTSSTDFYCSGKNTLSPPISLYCVDRDGDGLCRARSNQDFIIQAVRSANVSTTVADVANQRTYLLAVRVYRVDAFNTARNPAPLRCNSPNNASCNNAAGQKTTQQTGYNLGDSRRGSPLISSKAPLVEMVTEISDPNSATFRDFCNRLANTNATNSVGSSTVTCP